MRSVVCPKVKCVIAGRRIHQLSSLSSLSPDSKIEFTGTVPDIGPYLAAATLVIVPLRFGSGTRVKILEACAAGKPVVSTSIGAEGLILEPGKEIIIADDPAEFAESVVAMLQDPARRDAIASFSRAAVTKRYSHIALKQSLDAFLSGLT